MDRRASSTDAHQHDLALAQERVLDLLQSLAQSLHDALRDSGDTQGPRPARSSSGAPTHLNVRVECRGHLLVVGGPGADYRLLQGLQRAEQHGHLLEVPLRERNLHRVAGAGATGRDVRVCCVRHYQLVAAGHLGGLSRTCRTWTR